VSSTIGAGEGDNMVGDALHHLMSRRRLLASLGAAAAAFGGIMCRGASETPNPPAGTTSPQATGTGSVGAFAENNGVRIYYEVQGSSPPLLLHHGWAGSSQGWRQFGYVDALTDSYRVIAMDARGHGRSDKPHDEAEYTMGLRTGDVLAVLDAVGVDQVHYWGYSMGGRTGFALLQWHADRVSSFINGAAAPTSPRKYEEQRIRQWAEAVRTGDAAVMARTLGVSELVVRGLIGENDVEALAAAQLGLLSWDGVDPATLTVPSFHYAGEQDPILPATRRAAEAMPGAIFKMIPGLNHLTGLARSDLVLPLVRAFLGTPGARGQ
jgi:pimeloyl-ACP methyl ester carboxylesterase